MTSRSGPPPSIRILLVAERFPVLSESFIANRFLRLLERGWDVHILASEIRSTDLAFFPALAPYVDRIHRRPPIPSLAALVRLPFVLACCVARAPRATLRYLVRAWRTVGPRALWRLAQDAEVVALSPDVVHYTFGYLVPGRELIPAFVGARSVVSFQGADLNYIGLERDPGYYSGVWERTDAIHFLSEDLERRALRRGHVPDGREMIVKPGIDLTEFRPSDRGERIGPLRILSVGRLHWKKGYDYALQAVRDLVDAGVACEYRIIGEGELTEAVRFTISDLGLQDVAQLLGPLSADQVRDELQRADVFLHAATSEGFCYAVVEAQAMELPVVTSDADGLPENVADGETGFVVPRRDARALADALVRLAKDTELRTRMGRAGRRRALSEFTVDREIDGFEALYRKAVGADG